MHSSSGVEREQIVTACKVMKRSGTIGFMIREGSSTPANAEGLAEADHFRNAGSFASGSSARAENDAGA
ncbi:MAG: hypothetical protein JNM74_18310 [Myxococcales bacterium]|nr:hypothetical protein [Myxococcales bacterium]